MNEAEVDSTGDGKCAVMLVDSLSCVQLTKKRFIRLMTSSALKGLRCGLLLWADGWCWYPLPAVPLPRLHVSLIVYVKI